VDRVYIQLLAEVWFGFMNFRTLLLILICTAADSNQGVQLSQASGSFIDAPLCSLHPDMWIQNEVVLHGENILEILSE
jgi:hypothetical protein